MKAVARLAAFLVVCLTLATTAYADVPREDRTLLLVMDLSGPARDDLRWFYRVAEGYMVHALNRYGNEAYGSVWLLAGEKATGSAFQRSLVSLAASHPAVDVMIELHGEPGAITFSDGAHNSSEIAESLRRSSGLSAHLRAIYSAACYGQTHLDDWLAAGFRVASGARKVNTNGAYDFPAFVKSWTSGATFAHAQELGNNPAWRRLFDRAARQLGIGDDTDSFKEVRGTGETTILSEVSDAGTVETAEAPEAVGLLRVDDAVEKAFAPRSEDLNRFFQFLGFKPAP